MVPILSAFCGEIVHPTELKYSGPILKNQFSCEETQGNVNVEDIWLLWQNHSKRKIKNQAIFGIFRFHHILF